MGHDGAVRALIGLSYLEFGFKSVLYLWIRIDTVGEFLSQTQLGAALAPLVASVRGVDYAQDLAANRSRIHVDLRLPRHDIEEAMVKSLEDLPSGRRVRVRRPAG